jgi:hypothetical protein
VIKERVGVVRGLPPVKIAFFELVINICDFSMDSLVVGEIVVYVVRVASK